MDRRVVGLIFLGIVLMAIGPFVHAQNADTAADAQCPAGGMSGGVMSGYYPDEPKNSDFTDQGKKYHNLYGQPCSGPIVKASCKSADFCDATMSGSQCNDNGTWGACKETTPGKTVTASNGTSDAPPSVSSDSANPQTPVGQAGNTAQSAPPSGGNTSSSGSGNSPTAGSGQAAQSSSGNSASASQSSSGESQAPASNAPVSQTPVGQAGNTAQSAPPSSSSGPIFNGGSATNGLPQPTTNPSNPFPTSSTGQPQSGPYTPTQSTFPSQSSQSSGSGSGGRSSLTNFVSSVGNFASSPVGLSSVLNFFTGLLSIAAPSQTIVEAPAPQSISNIVLVNGAAPPISPIDISSRLPSVPAALSLDFFDNQNGFTSLQTSATATQASYPTLLDLINAQTAVATTSGITITNALVPSVGSSSDQTFSQTVNAFAPVPTFASSTPTLPTFAFDMVSDLNGEWTYSPQHLNDEASLAEAKSNYEWLQAQIQAMQAAQSAGVCGDTCGSALATLQSELPDAQAQIQQLTQSVNAPPPANFGMRTPSEILAQVIGFGPSSAISNNPLSPPSNGTPSIGDLASQSSELPPIIVQIPQTPPNFIPVPPSTYAAPENFAGAQEAPPPPNPITQFVSQLWGAVKSWFEPTATSTPDQAPSCSLFASLFGGCKGW